MPDPSMSDAIREAYATAPADDVVIHTLELRHPGFVDDDGNPDSIWVTTNNEDVVATIEADAPLKGGQAVTFRHFAFNFQLASIEAGTTPTLQVSLDAVDRRIVENLDLAIVQPTKIVMCYRPFLASDLGEPQMIPPATFTLSDVKVDPLTVTAQARIDIDLDGAFPRRVYTAAEFPALIGQ
jgi:hypothetical protein